MTVDQAAACLAQLSGKPVRPYSTVDFGREQNPAGRSVVVPAAQAAGLVAALRRALAPGWVAFIGCTHSLAKDAPRGSEVVVGPGDSQFAIVYLAQSDAANYDMDTADLVAKLREYHAGCGIDIVHAETDAIEFTLLTLPADMAGFCEDLYAFCPDVVDQGVGTMAALVAAVQESRTVYLWWD